MISQQLTASVTVYISSFPVKTIDEDGRLLDEFQDSKKIMYILKGNDHLTSGEITTKDINQEMVEAYNFSKGIEHQHVKDIRKKILDTHFL